MEVEEEGDEDEEVVRFFFLRTSGALLEKAAKGAASWRGACGSIGIAGCTAVKAGAHGPMHCPVRASYSILCKSGTKVQNRLLEFKNCY